MLYALHEMQRIAWAPARMMAEAGRQAAANPLLPMAWHPAGRAVGAFCELFERVSRKHGKPEFGIREVQSAARRLVVREEVTASTPFCDLLHFACEGRAADPVVLVVAPLSGHFATLLRDTVRGLLAEHDVYITDWQDARQVPAGRGAFTLDDYIDTLLDSLARELGPALTRELIMTCRPFNAQEAMKAGFLNRVVPPSDLDLAVDELVSTLCDKPGEVLRTVKRTVLEATEEMLAARGRIADVEIFAAISADPESQRSAAAYIADHRRSPTSE